MKYTHKFMLSFLALLLLFAPSAFAQDDPFFVPKTTVGGYGELHYNYEKVGEEEGSATLDFHRFVLFYSHAWNEEWSFKSEVELEHNFVKDGHGELELEQAYVNYHHSDAFGVRAGVILPSAGLINEYHEPPLFLSVERPEYHKYIIPTTWFGNGAAVYGNYSGLDYKFTVMEALDADGISASSGIRGARQKGYKASANQLLYNLRIDYTGYEGLRAGVSATYNKAQGEDTEIPLYLVEAHAAFAKNGFYSVFEIGNISYEDFAVENSFGYYFDLGYNVARLADWKTEIIPFVRYTDYNTAASTITGCDSESANRYSKWMAGISVKPIDFVVLKIDYGVRTNELTEVDEKLFNLGVGYMF